MEASEDHSGAQASAPRKKRAEPSRSKPLTVAQLIALLAELPPEAEVQIIRPLSAGETCTGPAYDIEYTEIGPLKYVNLI